MKRRFIFGCILLILVTVLTAACAEPDQAGPTVKDAAEARQTAIVYLQEKGIEEAPSTDINWQETDETPPGLLGAASKFYTADGWAVSVSYPVVHPDLTVYRVVIMSTNTGQYWKGDVKADGTVIEISAFQKLNEEASKWAAEDFVKNSATFVFDGIEGSLQLTETLTLRCPYCWQFILEFDSAHAGYGDRTGQMLAQVITHHVAVITIDHLEVTRAVMDDRWDMLTQQNLQYSEEASREIADEFVKNSPTFVFDGIESSLTLTETLYPDIENAWQFVFSFESRHSGYGDRTGQNLLQVITPHQAIVTVENGKVINAIMDEKWDMLQQRMIDESPPPHTGVPAAPNDSIVTAKVIDVVMPEGDMPWEITVEILTSEDVSGLNNATKARIGETIAVKTSEDASNLEKGQVITAHVQLRGDERTKFFEASEIK